MKRERDINGRGWLDNSKAVCGKEASHNKGREATTIVANSMDKCSGGAS